MTATYQCPKCGVRVTVFVTVLEPPVCAHNGRASNNNPASTMKEIPK